MLPMASGHGGQSSFYEEVALPEASNVHVVFDFECPTTDTGARISQLFSIRPAPNEGPEILRLSASGKNDTLWLSNGSDQSAWINVNPIDRGHFVHLELGGSTYSARVDDSPLPKTLVAGNTAVPSRFEGNFGTTNCLLYAVRVAHATDFAATTFAAAALPEGFTVGGTTPSAVIIRHTSTLGHHGSGYALVDTNPLTDVTAYVARAVPAGGQWTTGIAFDARRDLSTTWDGVSVLAGLRDDGGLAWSLSLYGAGGTWALLLERPDMPPVLVASAAASLDDRWVEATVRVDEEAGTIQTAIFDGPWRTSEGPTIGTSATVVTGDARMGALPSGSATFRVDGFWVASGFDVTRLV